MKDMKETIQTLLISRKSLFVFLCLMLLTSIVPLPFWGSDTGYTASFFSITSDNEPLKEVLAKISKSTGYKIEITRGWDNKTLTASLRKVNLENGLREIMRMLGEPNYSLIINDSLKKVEIRIFDDSVAGQKRGSGLYVGTKADFRKREKAVHEQKFIGADAAMKRSMTENEEMENEIEKQNMPEPAPDIEVPAPE